MEKWYPRHMSDAKLELIDNLKSCDTVLEVIDARTPFASKNKELSKMLDGKNKVLIINKVDLIDPKIANSLVRHFHNEYRYVLSTSAKDFVNIKKLFQILEAIFSKKQTKMARRGINAMPIRVIVLGIPNVGKSKIINVLTGRKIAKVADKPGVTRGKQWIKILPNVDMLDTPGILWTNNTKNEMKKLVLINALKDSEDNMQQGAIHLIEIVSGHKIAKFYDVDVPATDNNDNIELVLEKISEKLKLAENEVCKKIVRDFRNGLFGNISLESA